MLIGEGVFLGEARGIQGLLTLLSDKPVNNLPGAQQEGTLPCGVHVWFKGTINILEDKNQSVT